MCLIVGQFGLDRRHNVKALAARQLGPTGEALGFENTAQLEGGLNHEWPLNALSRIEIKHEHVGVLHIVHFGVPRVELRRANLDQPQETVEIFDPYTGASAALAFPKAELSH